jgi:hypothetical protein
MPTTPTRPTGIQMRVLHYLADGNALVVTDPGRPRASVTGLRPGAADLYRTHYRPIDGLSAKTETLPALAKLGWLECTATSESGRRAATTLTYRITDAGRAVLDAAGGDDKTRLTQTQSDALYTAAITWDQDQGQYIQQRSIAEELELIGFVAKAPASTACHVATDAGRSWLRAHGMSADPLPPPRPSRPFPMRWLPEAPWHDGRYWMRRRGETGIGVFVELEASVDPTDDRAFGVRSVAIPGGSATSRALFEQGWEFAGPVPVPWPDASTASPSVVDTPWRPGR